MERLLEGVRVLEASDCVGARYCGRLFAAMGAEVLRTAAPDDSRIGYGATAGEAYGRWLDQGKRVGPLVSADLADLVIGGQTRANVRRAEAERNGRFRDATLLALTWFGEDGPYADYSATDETIGALCGVAYSFGEAEGPPMLAQGHGPQITAGLVAFIAAMAALMTPRERRPRRVDVNVLEAAMCFSETGAVSTRVLGTKASRLGVNRFVPTYPCSPYRTSDGWVGVTCLTPAQWRALCGLIDRPDLLTDARFATAYERLLIGDEVDEALAIAFPHRTTDDWVALGMAHRIPIAPMVHPGDLLRVDHWRSRGAFSTFGDTQVQGPTLPFRMAFDGVQRGRPEGGLSGPLAGLRVVDFTMGWAGPLCTRTLGDLGADVVKIESEGHPDWWRGWEAGAVDATTRETKHNFIDVNRNKRGADIDLTDADGRERAKALITRADVVVENFAAGVLEKLGLGPAVQRALNPGVISLSMPAFGNDGPLSGMRAYGSTVEQASGMPFVNGESTWPPAQQHIALGDPVAGLYGAAAVLAAIFARDRLGGADIDLAQVACLFELGADAIVAEQVLGAPVSRTGHARPRLAHCAVVRSAGDDRWLAVAAPGEAEVEAMARVVGGDLPTWALVRTAEDGTAALQEAGVPAAPIAATQDLSWDPQLCAAGFWEEMDRAFVGRHHVAAAPFRFDGTRPALLRPAPLLGEHTAEIIAELLVAGTR